MVSEVAAPVWFAVIPCVAALLIAIGCVMVRRAAALSDDGPAPIAPFVWAGCCALAAVAAALWCALGLYEGDVPALCALSASTLLAAGLVLFHKRMLGLLSATTGAAHVAAVVARDVCVLALASVASVLALELPWNKVFPNLLGLCLGIELVMVVLAVVALYFLCQRRGVGPSIVIAACTLIGLAQYFVVRFKGASILPSDLYALGTAAAVSGGYTYAVDANVAWAIAASLTGMGITSLLGAVPEQPVRGRHAAGVPQQRGRGYSSGARIGFNVAMGVLALAALGVFVIVPNYQSDFDVKLDYWFTVDRYSEDGFLTAFVAAAQDLPVKAPEGYTEQQAVSDEKTLAGRYDEAVAASEDHAAAVTQFGERQPSVVAVMNETFADLTLFSDVIEGYEGPTYFRSISDALVRGPLAVSVVGGGTCNTEFEFLTGNSYSFVGAGKYPYVMYQLGQFDNLARQLSGLGYTCSAMHPNEAKNWNRDVVYASMGFDRFYSIDDFEGEPTLHSGVSDAATYDKVLELLESNEEPQFIFDVTMQNHSGYDQHNMPDELLRHYDIRGFEDDEWTTDAVAEYLACIDASDQALKDFMARLAELERPVVLLFFGDHQPHFSVWLNDDMYQDEDSVTHNLRAYQTNYIMWANYEVAGHARESEQDMTSPDTLAAMLLDMVGAPLSQTQRARIAARKDVPALNLFGYQGADRVWYATDVDSNYKGTYDAIARISYHNFGERL